MASSFVDVAIVGAGPYGLSIAAHLRARAIPFRIFGAPMQFWREMPPAMYLKSFGSTTDVYTPQNRFPFTRYSLERGLEPEEPCAIADFARYGVFVQQQILPSLEPVEVAHLARDKGVFKLTLANGETVWAGQVVVAVGLKAFARMPQELQNVPPQLASHTCEHSTFETFQSKKVYVLGAGQSALQAAALLHECGAQVEVLVRKKAINFSSRMASNRSVLDRVLRPKSGLGVGLKNWFLDTFPGLLHLAPDRFRVPFVKRYLGPSVAWWLRERVTDRFPIHTNVALRAAHPQEGRLVLTLADQQGGQRQVTCDHVIAGTGFTVDLDRLNFLDDDLKNQIARIENAPRLDRSFQSSVNGLYFVGTMSAMSFGPLFRFVIGAKYTSRVLARALARAPARVDAQRWAPGDSDTLPQSRPQKELGRV